MDQEVRSLRTDVDELKRGFSTLREGYGMRDRFLFGWMDHEGHHKGVIEVLSDGMAEANRNLERIDTRVSSFLDGLRHGVERSLKWLAGITAAAIGATLWFVAQHPQAVVKAVHDLLQ